MSTNNSEHPVKAGLAFSGLFIASLILDVVIITNLRADSVAHFFLTVLLVLIAQLVVSVGLALVFCFSYVVKASTLMKVLGSSVASLIISTLLFLTIASWILRLLVGNSSLITPVGGTTFLGGIYLFIVPNQQWILFGSSVYLIIYATFVAAIGGTALWRQEKKG